MKSDKKLSVYVQKYFINYMAMERHSSHHTIRSYRDTFSLLLRYFSEVRHISPDLISIEDLKKDTVKDFLTWLQNTTKCKSITRNQRMAALKSFAKYMQYEDPIHMGEWSGIRNIPNQKYDHGEIRFISLDTIRRLLEIIPSTNISGRRHLMIISLLYETAMRASEICDLTPSSLRLEMPYMIQVKGKGNKTRLIPIDKPIVNMLKVYMKENHISCDKLSDRPLFTNCYGDALSPSGISYIVNKYANCLRKEMPYQIPNKIGPHDLRRSRAMHWLQAGVDIYYIKDILGHEDIKTTERYAKADSQMKRIALEKASEIIGKPEPEIKSWEKSPKLIEFLNGLTSTNKRDTKRYHEY